MSISLTQFHHNEPLLNPTVPETILGKPNNRWRVVSAKLRSYKAFLLKPSQPSCSLEYDRIDGSEAGGVEGIQGDDEAHVHPDDGSFPIEQSCLSELVKDKKLDKLKDLGGVEGIASALKIDKEKGIQGDEEDITNRREAFGDNTYKQPPTKGFFHFVWEAGKDLNVYAMLGWAAFSLVYGIKEHDWASTLVNCVVTLASVLYTIVFSAVGNFIRNRGSSEAIIGMVGNFIPNRLLPKTINKIEIEVVRKGRPRQISTLEIVVGDVVCLNISDQVPADGLFLDGYALQVDESTLTGESDHVEVSRHNPFLLSGTKVVDGYGHMLVTSVGMNTTWGEMTCSISPDNGEETPLHTRLNKLTAAIRKVGFIVALVVLVVLLVRYFTGNSTDEHGVREFNGSKTKVGSILGAVINIVGTAVAIVVVATPEGLPLGVTLVFIRYFTGSTTDENNVWELNGRNTKHDDKINAGIELFMATIILTTVMRPGDLLVVVVLLVANVCKTLRGDEAMVRKLSLCETMGSATSICTDKTGTLTMNQMKVTKFWLGQEAIDQSNQSSISPFVLELLQQGVALNTTESVCGFISGSKLELSGSPTEKAILSWAVLDLGMDMEAPKQRCEIIDFEAFNSCKKRSGVLIRNNDDDTSHVHWKGAAEMVLAMCSSYYDASGMLKDLDDRERDDFQKTIQGMAANSLRCIAFAHTQIQEVSEVEKISDKNMTLLGLVGLKDPCRPRVKKAVQDCQHAGVSVKMVTGDNIFTARAIATECGILGPNQDMPGAVVEGAEFRNYTDEERMEKVDKICVMARSSPFDKLLMVRCLKQKGHIVAAAGNSTSDAPVLKEANIGFSMGTRMAKENSDIVILDDNFVSVAVVLKWGRCVYNNIQRLIQFQLTFNVAAITFNFIAAISTGEIPLTAAQFLWVKFTMDILGALALATEQPTKELMEKPPVEQTEPLVTNIMWRNLLAQAFYQISILLTLLFWGKSIFNMNEKVRDTLIFNTLLLCQVFNEFNATDMEKKNVFKGVFKNWLFLGIVGVTIVLQVVMVEFLNEFAERLNWGQWGACIGMTALSWLIGWIVKCIPVLDTPILSYLEPKKNRILGWINSAMVDAIVGESAPKVV